MQGLPPPATHAESSSQGRHRSDRNRDSERTFTRHASGSDYLRVAGGTTVAAGTFAAAYYGYEATRNPGVGNEERQRNATYAIGAGTLVAASPEGYAVARDVAARTSYVYDTYGPTVREAARGVRNSLVNARGQVVVAGRDAFNRAVDIGGNVIAYSIDHFGRLFDDTGRLIRDASVNAIALIGDFARDTRGRLVDGSNNVLAYSRDASGRIVDAYGYVVQNLSPAPHQDVPLETLGGQESTFMSGASGTGPTSGAFAGYSTGIDNGNGSNGNGSNGHRNGNGR